MEMIEHQLIKSHLDYDPATGIFRWKLANSNRVKVGDVAGCISKWTHGYVKITVNGRMYAAHRLAWLFVYGEWPARMIDHINNDRSDNKICNLRIATNSQNKMNANSHSDSKSIYCGVFWEKGAQKWRAQIMKNGIKMHLGVFDDELQAAQAYDLAAREIHGAFAKLNFDGGEHRKAK